MQTERLSCESAASRTRSIRRAGAILKSGGIVGFPTETVYGLAVVAGDDEAEARLREVRGRQGDKPFTIAVADVRTVSEFVGRVSPLGHRLMDRCWPGPLTIVFEIEDQRTVGLRLPANDVARAMIRKAGGAVLAPSANVPDKPPATTCEDVLAVFDGKIDAVLDDGPASLGKPSTVVRLRDTRYEVLREGALSTRRLQRAANLVILFVCSGNSCRSPIAEALCRKMLAERLDVDPETLEEHGYTVLSGGTVGGFAAPASPSAIQIAREIGIDISNHLSQTVTAELLEHCDRILVMTPEQRDKVLKISPRVRGRVMLLDPKGLPVGDPHGGTLDTYRRCALVIRKALEKRMKEL
ncbi:MAG TPA: L-threonylcarbamoyladenylate synthase [Planctomycetota bacterium]|nr:L-threonylcarbamoyladenylate synthase [Planctomycetota bacterium]